MLGRRNRSDPTNRRRSGPADEERWWDPADQAFVESPLLRRRDFPKGWEPTMMLNNLSLIDPYEGVEAAAIRTERVARQLSALDEAIAFRAKHRQLLVLRTEMYVERDETAHRAAWLADGRAVLTRTYQARWAERDVTPNWIETTVRPALELPDDVDPRIDWLRVEDHTDPRRSGVVSLYEHLTLWCGRANAVVTVRHEHDQQVDFVAVEVARRLLERLESVPDPDDEPDDGP